MAPHSKTTRRRIEAGGREMQNLLFEHTRIRRCRGRKHPRIPRLASLLFFFAMDGSFCFSRSFLVQCVFCSYRWSRFKIPAKEAMEMCRSWSCILVPPPPSLTLPCTLTLRRCKAREISVPCPSSPRRCMAHGVFLRMGRNVFHLFEGNSSHLILELVISSSLNPRAKTKLCPIPHPALTSSFFHSNLICTFLFIVVQ
jgi:hypothetical protein